MAARPGTRKRDRRPAATAKPRSRGKRASRQPARARFPVVALGASAGGLEAYEKFFAHMPPNSGLAFVLVPHLDAHHKSAMTELMRRYTRMPVVEIAEGMAVEANRVHVIPPNTSLSIQRGALHIVSPRSQTNTIDGFLKSLAEDQAENAIGIILSGSGSDGTLGIKAIKEQGGLTLAQAGQSLRYESMPHSAVATGLVDFVLPVEDMPEKLIEHATYLGKMRTRGTDGFREEVRRHLARIYTLLRTATGHDFSRYKDSTFIRRVQRRMQVAGLASITAYVALLRRERSEIDLLFRDLLIGVTHFFRDPRAFEAVAKEVLPKIIAAKRPDDQIRIWIAGCATGEEAYSIAILVREQLAQTDAPLKVQIFATDIDDQALETARAGRYPEAIARDVSPERLQRFFVRDGSAYAVVKEIREMCIFSVHNLIKDAPFSKLDLISCRNLLIYLDQSLQNRIIPLFHFALRHGGYLFLGPSEQVTQHSRLFSKVDVRNRIFKARPVEIERPAVDFPLSATSYRERPNAERIGVSPAVEETMTRRAARIMENYAPAYVVIDEHSEVLHFAGRTGKFLQPSPGTASLNLFNILETSLRPDVRTALHEALANGRRVLRENVFLTVNGGTHAVNIIVEPIQTGENGLRYAVVAFQDLGAAPAHEPGERPGEGGDQKDETIAHLEAELMGTRERLQATIEELETSNEEMKASNEEFQSVNEELQSSNEELETSKEELQSVNEELATVNAELNSKLESLERATNDRKNLLESTQIATIFLDEKLRIKSFTPAVSEVFHLIETDYGRPIADIVTRLDYGDLERDVRRVLRTLAGVEHQVTLADGSASYMMRILPYRTVDNVIDGVVVTFVDITERKRNEEDLARLAAVVETSHEAIVGMTPDGTITTWNAGAERTYGYTASEAAGRPLSILIPDDRMTELRQMLDRLKRGRTGPVETERLTKDGRRIYVSASVSAIRNAAGKIVAGAAIERDVTERRQAEERQKMLVAELNHRVKNMLATVMSVAARTIRGSDSLSAFGEAFEGRIQALAKAHDLLAATSWAGADLRDVALTELAPYRERARDRVTIDGDKVFLNANAALLLGMVFHELAVNAAKHGAFSADKGRVRLDWSTAGNRHLALNWQETDGPKLKGRPQRDGFGLKLIERSIADGLQGKATLSFMENGLHCGLEIPLAEALATSH